MIELEIGKGEIGDGMVGGPVVLFDGDVKDFGAIKLVQVGHGTFDLTIDGKTIKLVGSGKAGNA